MAFCRNYWLFVFLSVSLFLPSFPVQANLVKLVITKTEPYAGGRTFGKAGTYERVYGQAYGEVDPNPGPNKIIQDLQLAPRNKWGFVEYISEFILLHPADMDKSNGLLFLSLPNRGKRISGIYVATKTRVRISVDCLAGDVLAGNSRLTIKVPVATENGLEITGKVRAEFQVFTPAQTQYLSSGPFSGATHHSYETVSLDNTSLKLTKRVHEADPPIPNSGQ